MPKYLFQGSYTADGAKGLLKDGGTKRRAMAQQLIQGLGGKLEAFYFTFGKTDFVGIVDLPDNASVAAASLNISASGALSFKTTVLLTPEEMDQATKKTVAYTPPGR
jgi:uncharacterized protein with GYD domain